jgi:prevent-host-death family protein
MRVSITTGRANFSRLIRSVEKGERIIVARSGKPVAVIGPLPPELQPTPDEDQWLTDFLAEIKITLD